MEMIISRFGTHAFFQFDRIVINYTIMLLDNNGKLLHKYLLNNKDFLLVNGLNSDENYTIKIKDSHNEIIARKKI
jgi:hypothetical protein